MGAVGSVREDPLEAIEVVDHPPVAAASFDLCCHSFEPFHIFARIDDILAQLGDVEGHDLDARAS